MLDALLERVLKHRGIAFLAPVFPQQEYPRMCCSVSLTSFGFRNETPEEEEDEEMEDAEITHDEVFCSVGALH